MKLKVGERKEVEESRKEKTVHFLGHLRPKFMVEGMLVETLTTFWRIGEGRNRKNLDI